MTSATATRVERRYLRWSGALLLLGLILDAAVTTLFHPSGDEDVPVVVFAEYAASDWYGWVHLGQLIGVLLTLGGLLLLHQALRSRAPDLSGFAAALTVAAALAWAVLQALDGVVLKRAVDAWVATDGPAQALRLSDAETVQLSEWGVQGYVHVLLGAGLLLFGSAILTSRLMPRWTGWVAVLAGILSVAVGVDLSYNGLESESRQMAWPAFQIVLSVFAIGVTIAAVAGHRRESAGR
jgi:hypothetical protein